MKIRSAWRKLASAILGVMLLFTWGASANEPRNIVPGTPDSLDFFYVFGPSGAVGAGKKDTNQTVWVRLPASAQGDLTLYVWDAASGSKYEQKSGFWTSCTTQFSVFGGPGAASTVSGGELLESRSYSKDVAARDQWVAFGPYPVSKAEVFNGYRWFRFSADGIRGSGVNFFKLGASSGQAEFLTYELSFHTGGQRGRQVNFGVEMPTQGRQVTEVNYDYDNGNIPYLNGQLLKASASGSSTSNTVADIGTGNRLNYVVEKGSQDYANGAVWFKDGQGNPLYIFLTPALNVPAPAGNCQTTRTSLVTLTKCLPPQVVLGQEFSAILTVTASQEVANVVVTDLLGDGATVVRTEPAAQRAGNNLVWKVDRMAAGESRVFEVVLNPGREGEIGNCATISAEPVACVVVSVGKPVLAITKTGPAQALLGSQVPYSITVTNTGTAPATDVVVRDSVPAGLSHASGDKTVVINVGTLAPGQSVNLPVVSLRADQRGRHCNVAVATSSNAGEVRAEACTLVVQQGLAIAKTGTKEQFANKVADYEITVTNTGDVSLTNVVVTDTPPTGTRVVKTQPAASMAGNSVSWNIAELKAGEKQSFSISLVSPVGGNLCNQVSARSNEGPNANAEACTLWRGHPALLIEVVDTVDPLLPGESTTYIIQVKNQGTAPDHNVGIIVRMPPSISATGVSGVTAGSIAGKVVTFPPVAMLAPQQVVEWRVEAKADVTAGDSRVKVEMRSDLLKTPVVEEESTHVY